MSLLIAGGVDKMALKVSFQLKSFYDSMTAQALLDYPGNKRLK